MNGPDLPLLTLSVPIPILLLKTKSIPHDSYEEDFFSTSNPTTTSTPPAPLFQPVFVPVLEHQPIVQNLEVVKRWLREVGGDGDDGGLKGRERMRRRRRRYGGMIFTSQRAVEGFAAVVEELEEEKRMASRGGDKDGLEEEMVARDEGRELSMIYPNCRNALLLFSSMSLGFLEFSLPSSLCLYDNPSPCIPYLPISISQSISNSKLTSSFSPPSPVSISISNSTSLPFRSHPHPNPSLLHSRSRHLPHPENPPPHLHHRAPTPQSSHSRLPHWKW